MIRDDLKARVIAWAEARNFFGEGGATVEGQLAKLLEEASELVTDIVRGRDATDSVGDCLVVLVILERMGCVVVWNNWPHHRTAFQCATHFAEIIARSACTAQPIFADALCDAAQMLRINFDHALTVALAEIEPRRGSWSGGVFVKESQA